MNNPMRRACVMMTAAIVSMSFAQAEVVVIVNPKNAAASMTAAQVAGVFLGKDISMTPPRGEFYTKVASKDEAQMKAVWASAPVTSPVNVVSLAIDFVF